LAKGLPFPFQNSFFPSFPSLKGISTFKVGLFLGFLVGLTQQGPPWGGHFGLKKPFFISF